MSLDEFALAGLVVDVYSDALGTDVLFVSDNVAESALSNEHKVVYRAIELRKLALLRPSPEHLRRVHEVKLVFRGFISAVEDRRQGAQTEAEGAVS